jgi:hypothetical protein
VPKIERKIKAAVSHFKNNYLGYWDSAARK